MATMRIFEVITKQFILDRRQLLVLLNNITNVFRLDSLQKKTKYV